MYTHKQTDGQGNFIGNP